MSILRIEQLDYHAASDDKGEGFRLSVDQFTMFAGDKVAIVEAIGCWQNDPAEFDCWSVHQGSKWRY